MTRQKRAHVLQAWLLVRSREGEDPARSHRHEVVAESVLEHGNLPVAGAVGRAALPDAELIELLDDLGRLLVGVASDAFRIALFWPLPIPPTLSSPRTARFQKGFTHLPHFSRGGREAPGGEWGSHQFSGFENRPLESVRTAGKWAFGSIDGLRIL